MEKQLPEKNSVFRAIRWCMGLPAICFALTVWAQDFESTERAAQQGDAKAQGRLAVMYAEGRGIAQSDAEAAQWFRKAAWQGDARAQYKLGLMYAKGQGVTRNDTEAMRWYRKAAQQGDVDAKAALDAMKKANIARAYDVNYLKEGMNASVARKLILNNQWNPNRSRHSREIPMWGVEKRLYQRGFTEIDSCAVDGPWCLLKYKKDEVCLEVQIEGSSASRMRVTSWVHDCEPDS